MSFVMSCRDISCKKFNRRYRYNCEGHHGNSGSFDCIGYEMKLPKPGTKVIALLEHWHTKGKRKAELIRVNEDDCAWRTVDDRSEISYDWNVIHWEVLRG